MQNKEAAGQVVFVVGCPRSGTTLLQTQLMRIDGAVSFSESHYYTGNKDFDAWKVENSVIGQDLGDVLAREAEGHRLVIEKTPDHLRYISRIKKDFPDAVFLHIQRSRKDNVASLQKASGMWGAPRGRLFCSCKWLFYLVLNLIYSRFSRHMLVIYENLASHPDKEIARIAKFLSIPYSEVRQAAQSLDDVSAVVGKNEAWKVNNFNPPVYKGDEAKGLYFTITSWFAK